MDEIRVRRKKVTDPIVFGTGEAQLIVVERQCVHVLDVEDTHLAHDRSILMPDIARVDGSEPTLDERRITGLGVIYAALIHKDRNPEQKVLVVGHTDPSGPASYNLELSEKRAENVQLFLSGNREDWRKQSDEESHRDDVNRILKFQATRAQWDCDPKQSKAVEKFQTRYNKEVKKTAAEGLDLPYKTEIGVDNDVGPETWGAFWDIYAHEVMRLLGTDSFAELEGKLAAMKGFDDVGPFVGCGENIPFESGRREAFDPDEELDRPERNPADRRVEIMFFDEEEKPDLVCHAGTGCDPSACPLYTTDVFCHREIGVPKGLQIGEVVMQLLFEDAEGKTHPLPAGVEVEVRFDDDSSETFVLTESGRVNFVTARDKSSFDLALTTEDGEFLVFKDDEAELLDRDEALSKVDDGARVFLLPNAFDTHDCDWRVPGDVAFEDGRFINLDNPATRIGTRGSPAKVVLVPRWQHFRFEYFDRWSEKRTTVPLPRPKQGDTPPLLLEGHASHVDYENGPTDPPIAESIWDIDVGGATVHCVAWVLRRPSTGAAPPPAEVDPENPAPGMDPPADTPRQLPDAESLTRFVLPEGTFIRTDGAPKADKPTRIVETIADGHEHFEEVSKPSAARLRYYDLPVQWWSRGYSARLGSGARQSFTKIVDDSSPSKPFVIDLDDIVVGLNSTTIGFDGKVEGITPAISVKFEDKDEDRFAIWDHRLAVHKPMAKDIYFTDVTKLTPKPDKSQIFDHPPFTRLITRGFNQFDVFDQRTPLKETFEDFPIGARMALDRHETQQETPFYSIFGNYNSPAADELRSTWNVGSTTNIVLRCCGVDGETEIFRLAQYSVAFFEFHPKSPPRGTAITPPVPAATALAEAQKSIIDSNARWNGTDGKGNGSAFFEIGPKDKLTARGQFHALVVRVANPSVRNYTINIVDDTRAFMALVCAWERDDMQVEGDGSMTAAHEWGHGFGSPDHYIETSKNASLHRHGIRDRFRSPGCPYDFDTKGMMNGSELKPRGYDFWHLALWLVDKDRSFAGEKEIAVKQGSFRYTTDVTARDKSRARHPVIAKVNQKVGAQGLCDVFAYCGGADGFNAGDGLHGATADKPWDMIVIVRVKMALTLKEDDHKPYNGGRLFVGQLQKLIHKVFNQNRRLLAKGTFEGRSIRARILFSPRFIVRTFPTGTSDDRNDYLDKIITARTEPDYSTKVNDLITESNVHCEITAVEDPDDHGITKGSATPREANLDTDDVEDEIVEIFGKLIGLTDPDEDDEPEQYGSLADQLGPTFARSSLEFVE